MNKTRNPDESLVPSEELLQLSSATGVNIGQLMCEGSAGESLSVLMLMPFLPPVGSRIALQNRSVVEVTRLLFDVVGNETSVFTLRPTVYAKIIKEAGGPDSET